MNYLKVGKATELSGNDRRLYRFFEILPGFLSWGTLILLIILTAFLEFSAPSFANFPVLAADSAADAAFCVDCCIASDIP
jgi:hypothetical protein